MSNTFQIGRIRMRTGVRVNNLSVVCVILIIVSVFSLLYGWVPILHSQAYIAILAILTTAVIAPRFFVTKQFFLILFYALVVWMNARAGDEYTFDKTVMDGLLLGMCGGVSFYLMESDDQKAKKWISILVLLVIIIQTVPSLVMYFVSQDTIRTFIILVYQGNDEMDWGSLYKMGIMNYDLTHGIPMLVPPLMMWLRMKGISKTWKFFCAVSLVCVLVSSYIYDVTTVQLLALFSIATSFLIYPNQNNANRRRLIIATVLILPFVFSTTLQDGILKRVSAVSEGELKAKVEDARYNLTHDSYTGDIANRSDLYMQSVNAFIESPLWGTNNFSKIGLHSAIFDRMGAFGLVGTVPYLLILFLFIRECKKKMSISSRWYFTICVISFFTLILLKNMSRLEEWLMFIVVAPAMLTLKEETIMKKNRTR